MKKSDTKYCAFLNKLSRPWSLRSDKLQEGKPSYRKAPPAARPPIHGTTPSLGQHSKHMLTQLKLFVFSSSLYDTVSNALFSMYFLITLSLLVADQQYSFSTATYLTEYHTEAANFYTLTFLTSAKPKQN